MEPPKQRRTYEYDPFIWWLCATGIHGACAKVSRGERCACDCHKPHRDYEKEKQ